MQPTDPRLLAIIPRRFPDAPPARYQAEVARNRRVVMRDGVRLATDLFQPLGASLPLPTILVRTPYNKAVFDRRHGELISAFVGQGFAVVVQDKRGRFLSEGAYRFARHDGEDGWDTLDWIIAQPWSNGRVGTYGCSYLGEVQYALARMRHPAHRAMIADCAGMVGALDGRYAMWGAYSGGALTLESLMSWFWLHGSTRFERLAPDLDDAAFAAAAETFDPLPHVPAIAADELFRSLPLLGALERSGALPNGFDELISHPPGDPWWHDEFPFFEGTEPTDVPAIHMSAWHDNGAADAARMFEQFRKHAVSDEARDNQHLILSPMCHCTSELAGEAETAGGRPLGDARFPYASTYLTFFRRHLKCEEVEPLPIVTYYLMGENRWRTSASWPPPGVGIARFFLQPDGQLTSAAPADGGAPRSFVYDPEDPTPSLGGRTFTSLQDEGLADPSSIETRPDMLVYESEPFVEALELCGDISCTLHISSSAPDTDMAARLLEVDSAGRAVVLQEGILRCRYRDDFVRPSMMQPGKTYPVKIDLGATASLVAAGHRLRLHVASSAFPFHDRNLNTGGDNVSETRGRPATNSVWADHAHPSVIELTVRDASPGG